MVCVKCKSDVDQLYVWQEASGESANICLRCVVKASWEKNAGKPGNDCYYLINSSEAATFLASLDEKLVIDDHKKLYKQRNSNNDIVVAPASQGLQCLD